jgi:serine phosphatase RsbU (regulator of sigma subunit)
VARAGHCPTLYYDSQQKDAIFLKNKGLGLGIIRNNQYPKHIEKQEMSYHSGDVLILYTDGIVEAKNSVNEEFGFDKLKNLLYLHHELNTKQLSEKIVEELYSFTGTKDLADDHTFLIIKFI